MQDAIDSRPMTVRKLGWRGLKGRSFRKLRAILPNYKLIVLLSIAVNMFLFCLRMAKTFSRSQNLRFFRSALLDFLKHTERASKTEIEILLQSLKGWEEKIPPEKATKTIEQQLKVFEGNDRVSELFFTLSNVHYLAGDFVNHKANVLLGLEALRNLRRYSPLDKLGVKFLFTEDWGWGIGHTAHLDQLVRLRELGFLSEHRRILVLSPEDGANKHYMSYWKQYFDVLVVTRHEARVLYSIMRPISEQLSGFELKSGFSTFYEAWNLAGDNWSKESRAPLLKLKSIDSENGWKILEKLGVPAGSWFVALHVREYKPHTPNNNKLRAMPNADIQTYMPAIQSIIARGGWVIRMGDASMSELSKVSGLIDYANSTYKSEWLDVFLWASCKFFIGTSSGPISVPPSFGVPVLYTNCCGIGISPALGKSLVIPKLFSSKSEKRFLSFSEILASPLGWTVRVPEDDDIELHDNSPDEILYATDEMFSKLDAGDGAFYNLSDLQEAYDQLRRKYGNNASTPISASFVNRYRHLLPQIK